MTLNSNFENVPFHTMGISLQLEEKKGGNVLGPGGPPCPLPHAPHSLCVGSLSGPEAWGPSGLFHTLVGILVRARKTGSGHLGEQVGWAPSPASFHSNSGPREASCTGWPGHQATKLCQMTTAQGVACLV